MTTEHPRRRWYQCRLRTILVLVGIAAWAMALRPWVDFEIEGVYLPNDWRAVGLQFSWHATKGHPFNSIDAVFFVNSGSKLTSREVTISIGPRPIVWPILTLAAFLIWKLGWAIVGGRVRRILP